MSDVDDGGDGPGDLSEEQQRLKELLTGEVRHSIIHIVLGHPEYLPSIEELDYFLTDVDLVDIRKQVGVFQDAGILTEYTLAEEDSQKDVPRTFFGVTEDGVEVLDKFNFLRGVPLNQAVIQATMTTDYIDTCLEAPRPDLPESVQEAFQIDESN